VDDEFAPTDRTTASRDRGRVSYQRATAYAVLDEAYHCHLGFAVTDPDTGVAEPRILPTLHVRVGDTLYLHGSTGSRPLLAARSRQGLPVCITVTHLDGIVLARSHFHHSANYRSVVVHGRARLVRDEEDKRRVLSALVDKIANGRAADSRPPTRKELAETAVLALPLTEVSVKARVGGVLDDPEDLDLRHWAGVVPMRLTPGRPEPDTGVTVPVPSYLRPARGPWLTAPALRGDHVVLEPLDMSHVDDLFAALDDDQVWRFLLQRRPRSAADLARFVAEALRMADEGTRVPFVQRSARTGEIIGTTSYYAVDEANRSIAIGWTIVARPWWRSGVNTEAKLLLLRRAFDDLGAVRVEWHTDLRNERSQRAIERLGAVREGVLRRQKRREDGTWRDTVLYAMTDTEWPAARDRLTTRLAAAPAAGPEPTARSGHDRRNVLEPVASSGH
jgi:RimJ/RimL family protein N-acetyltransferase/nitroimidazol reductase NimA-like FMN-containing flavoprotein (pyridoxamine 5'-phosphate oxidase superfamily)